ncbi:hypothetical protein [Streptomyces sp. NPDC054865]
MLIVDTGNTDLIARLKKRLNDVRYYGPGNHYSGTPLPRTTAWNALRLDGAYLVQIDALFGVYKVIVDDRRWYVLRPAVEFDPQPAGEQVDSLEDTTQAA